MKKNRFFILVAFALFVMLPFSVNAEEFKNGDTKYFIEKQNVTCEGVDLDALYEDDDWDVVGPTEKGNYVFLNKSDSNVIVIENQECITFKYGSSTSQEHMDYLLDGFRSSNDVIYGIYDSKIVMRTRYAKTIKIDNEFYIHVPSTTLDESKISEYYYINKDNFEDVFTIPLAQYLDVYNMTFDELQHEIDRYPFVAADILIKLGEDDYTKEEVMTIENEEVLEFIETVGSDWVEVYDYDPKHKVAYFIDHNADQINGKPIFDSKGNFYSYENIQFHYSGELIWGLKADFSSLEMAYVVFDENGNVIHKINSVQVGENIYLGSYYVPFHELGYDNNVYDFFINGINHNNRYKIYEYKLLSEDNRVIDGKTDFVTKFSGVCYYYIR